MWVVYYRTIEPYVRLYYENIRSIEIIVCKPHVCQRMRIQQLENESNQLEQNFQSYLERRKRCQEQEKNNQDFSKIHTYLHQITATCLRAERIKQVDLGNDEEQVEEDFQRLKENLIDTKPISVRHKTSKSESSTSSLEIRNAILEAKLKFFEHEKFREQEIAIRGCDLLQKEYKDFPEHHISTNFEQQTQIEEKQETNLESIFSEINIKDKTLDDEQDIDISTLMEDNSQKSVEIAPTSYKRGLFPKYSKPNDNFQANLESNKNSKQYFTGERTKKSTDTTSELIKQSMIKMQQLFEQQSKSQETLREIVNELQEEKVLKREQPQIRIGLRSNEVLDKSLTTTLTSTITATAATTTTSEDLKNLEKTININLNSHTPRFSFLNLNKESEDKYATVNPHDFKQLQEAPVIITELKKLEITIPDLGGEAGQIFDSSTSSKSDISPDPKDKFQRVESNLQHEFGEHNDYPKPSDINLNSPGNDKEIGETLTESNRTFASNGPKLFETFSSQSSSDLEISTGQQNIDAKNLGEDSDSDFWA